MAEVQKQDPMAERHDTELFYMLVRMISTNALVALGKLAPEGQQPPPPDFEAAAAFVDMLGMLEAKTAGNRNKDEDKIIKSSLEQLQMIFVNIVQEAQGQIGDLAKAVEEQGAAAAKAKAVPGQEPAAPAAPTPPAPAAPAAAPKPAAPAPAEPPKEEKVKFRKSYGDS